MQTDTATLRMRLMSLLLIYINHRNRAARNEFTSEFSSEFT